MVDLRFSNELWEDLIATFESVRCDSETMAATLAPYVVSDDEVANHHANTVRGQEETLLLEAVTSFSNAHQGAQEAHESLKAADAAGGN